MRVGYADSSWLLAIAFGETGSAEAAAVLERFDVLLSSTLLEAEVLATLHRERLPVEVVPTAAISWILPDRPLRREVEQVLASGYLRGADLWHVANALYVAPVPADLVFLTYDVKQRDVAQRLGFEVVTPTGGTAGEGEGDTDVGVGETRDHGG